MSKGKVAILSSLFAFLVYVIKSASFVRFFVKLAQYINIINGLNAIDFEIKLTISKEKVAISRYIFLHYFL